MGIGKIDHVDVVTDACAIRRGIVITEHRKLLETADCNLCNIGKKVVRNTCRIFADETTLMGADGIKVAKKDYVPGRIRLLDILEHLLHHQLRPAIGIGAARRGEVLTNRDGRRLAVHGRAG